MSTAAFSTGDAVLQAAIQIEQIGRDFYRALAAAVDEPRLFDLCRQLAQAELERVQTFQQMRAALAERGQTVMLAPEQEADNRASAKQAIVPDGPAVSRAVASGRLADLLQLAVSMEQDSIRFYSSLRAAGPAVQAIIAQEREHERALQAALSRIR